jgi:hypothetical protein
MPLSVSRGRLDHNARFETSTKVDTAHMSIQPAPHLQAISGMVGGGSGPFSIFLLDSRAIASNNQQCAASIHPVPPHPGFPLPPLIGYNSASAHACSRANHASVASSSSMVLASVLSFCASSPSASKAVVSLSCSNVSIEVHLSSSIYVIHTVLCAIALKAFYRKGWAGRKIEEFQAYTAG